MSLDLPARPVASRPPMIPDSIYEGSAFTPVTERFTLNPLFKTILRRKPVAWGYGQFSEFIFMRTYSHHGESWADVCCRVVEGTLSILKDRSRRAELAWDEDAWQERAIAMASAMHAFRWTPPGRGCFKMGHTDPVTGRNHVYERGALALNNPLAAGTPVITRAGLRPIAELAGQTVEFLTHHGWTRGTVRAFGIQPTVRITFAPAAHEEGNYRFTEVATPDHGWVLADRSATHDLQVGDVVQGIANNLIDRASPAYQDGFRHGLIFTGGEVDHPSQETRPRSDRRSLGQATATRHDPAGVIVSPRPLKRIPVDAEPDYITGFIDGWLVSDGQPTTTGQVELYSEDGEAFSWLRRHAALAGWFIVDVRAPKAHSTKLGSRKAPLIGLLMQREVTNWSVVAIEPAGEEAVFCAFVPGVHAFALGSGAYSRNCAGVDIKLLSRDAAWTMDALMLGAGVGFTTRHEVLAHLRKPREYYGGPYRYVISDDREGWVESVQLLLQSYEQPGSNVVVFDYSHIRPAGQPIRTFGGIASGPMPLRKLHERLRMILDRACTESGWTSSRLITDVINVIGACVVAGNVRRSATLALGEAGDHDFTRLKDLNRFPYRAEWAWMSNNSVAVRTSRELLDLPATIAPGILDNGEPGFVNVMNARNWLRAGEERSSDRLDYGVTPNPCVTGETRVLTRHGYEPIAHLVDTPVEIWNGMEWSLVIPRVTGIDQPIVRVTLSDGTMIDCTPYHAFMVTESYDQILPRRREARELTPGTKLWKYDMPVITEGEAIEPATAYTQGIFSGDGTIRNGRATVDLYAAKQMFVPALEGHLVGTNEQRASVTLTVPTVDKRFVPHAWDIAGRLAWLAGLIDTDGCLMEFGQVHITSVEPSFLREIKLMLTTMGCHAKIAPMHEAATRELPDGRGGVQLYDCRRCEQLQINASDVIRLRDLGIGRFLRRIDLSRVAPARDARRFVTVVSVEPIGTADKVYCFNEPIRQTGTFEGIVTGNCSEIWLWDKELCCLAEVYPTRCADLHEFLEACEFAALYTSAVSVLGTHLPMTNEVIARNHRQGVGITGVADWRDRVDDATCEAWTAAGLATIVLTQNDWADRLGHPRPIANTTVKPSGTMSLLAGVSAGGHWRTGNGSYIRRVRVSQGDTMLRGVLEAAGVPHEPDVASDNTEVYEFVIGPEDSQHPARAAADVSIWEQGEMVKWLQRHWSNNMVSYTISFDPDRLARELGHAAYFIRDEHGEIVWWNGKATYDHAARAAVLAEIEDFIAWLAPDVKSVSMLPIFNGVYAQLPEEPIPVEEYQRRKAAIKPFDWSSFRGRGIEEIFCDGASCAL